MITCLNFSIPEVKKGYNELSNVFNNEKAAYALMAQNNGFNIDSNPDGFRSYLFMDILNHPGIAGDRNKALRYKAKIYTDSYLDKNNWLQKNIEPTIQEFEKEFSLPKPVGIPQAPSIQDKAISFLEKTVENVAKIFDAASFTELTPSKWKNLDKVKNMLSKGSALFRKHGLFIHQGDKHIMKLNADLFENLFDEQRLVDRINEYMRNSLKEKLATPHNVISTNKYQEKRWLVSTDIKYGEEATSEQHRKRREKILNDNLKRIELANEKFERVVGTPAITLTLANGNEVSRGLLPKYIVNINEEVVKDYNNEMYVHYLNSLSDYFNRQEEEEVLDEFVVSPIKNKLRAEMSTLGKAKAALSQTGGKLSDIHALEDKIFDIKARLLKLTKDTELKDIQEEASIQLNEVEKLLEKSLLSPSEIQRATEKLLFWMKVGDFSGENHILLTPEDIKNKEIREAFVTIRAKAEDLNVQLSEKGRDTITYETSKKLKDPDGEGFTFQKVLKLTHKLGYFSKMTLSLNRVGHALAQFIAKIVNEANDKAYREAKIASRYLADLYDKVKQSGFDDRLYYQTELLELPDGQSEESLTGRLIHKFSNTWFKKRNSILGSNFDRKKYTITLNPELLFDLEGIERDKHYQEIVDSLGELEAAKYIEKARKKYEEFKAIRKEFIEAEFGTDASNLTMEQMDTLYGWLQSNSPMARLEFLEEYKEMDDIKNIPGKDSFLVIVPNRKTAPQFYDHKFHNIENNKNAYAFYQEMEDITNKAQAIFGSSDFTTLSMSYIEATLMSKLTGHGIGSFLSKDVWEELRNSFASHGVQSTQVDELTGKVVKKISKGVVAIDKKIENYAELLVAEEIQRRKKENILEGMTSEEENAIRVKASKQVFAEMGFDQNTHIFESINILNSASLTYRHLSMLEDTVNLAMSYLPNSTVSSGDSIIDQKGNPVGEKYISNMMEMVEHFLDVAYYKSPKEDTSGHILTHRSKQQKEKAKKYQEIIDNPDSSLKAVEEAKISLSRLGTKVTVDSLVRRLMDFIRIKALGWNFGAAAVNVVYGTITNIYKAFEGRMYTAKDWLRAEGEFWANNTKFNRILENYHIVGDIIYEFDEKNKFQQKQGWFFKTIKSLKPYAMQTGAEKKNQGTVMIAMMLNKKVTNSETGETKSVWEAINENGKLDNTWTAQENKGEEVIVDLIEDIKSTIQEIHGDYTNPLLIKKSMEGRTIAMFRLWFFEFFHSRFGAEKQDYMRGITTKGRYRSLFQALRDRRKWNEMSEVDKANMKMNLAEITMLASLFLLRALMKWAICGDDEQCKKANILQLTAMNLMNRLVKDAAMPLSAKGWKDFVENPTSFTSLFGDIARFAELNYSTVFGDAEDLVYQKGYNAGESKWVLFWKNQVPFLNQTERAKKYSEELLKL